MTIAFSNTRLLIEYPANEDPVFDTQYGGSVVVCGKKLEGFYVDAETAEHIVSLNNKGLHISYKGQIFPVTGLDFLPKQPEEKIRKISSLEKIRTTDPAPAQVLKRNPSLEKIRGAIKDQSAGQMLRKSPSLEKVRTIVVKDAKTNKINLLVIHPTEKGSFSLRCVSERYV